MHKIIDGGKLELAQPGQAKLESRYDYYRRCQALRTNGPQCKAPAMKDQNICRKHVEQGKNCSGRQSSGAILPRRLEGMGTARAYLGFRAIQ
jgi:hypothetical protein